MYNINLDFIFIMFLVFLGNYAVDSMKAQSLSYRNSLATQSLRLHSLRD